MSTRPNLGPGVEHGDTEIVDGEYATCAYSVFKKFLVDTGKEKFVVEEQTLPITNL